MVGSSFIVQIIYDTRYRTSFAWLGCWDLDFGWIFHFFVWMDLGDNWECLFVGTPTINHNN